MGGEKRADRRKVIGGAFRYRRLARLRKARGSLGVLNPEVQELGFGPSLALQSHA